MALSELPVEVLLGLYIGLLTGIVPAFVSGSLGFLVRYFTGVTLPGFGVVVLALSIASVQGGLLGLVEPTIAQSPRLLIAVLVVLMLALYAHNQGDKLGAELPRRLSLTRLRQRTLSADVVELVGSVGRVSVRPVGEIRDVEGYPPLPPELRRTLAAGTWRLPADLPLSELETRLEERLRTDHDLADVTVTIDERGRATIAAAPPSGSLSRRLPTGRRAVSVETLVPTGLAHGDDVTIGTGDHSIRGTVVGSRTDGGGSGDAPREEGGGRDGSAAGGTAADAPVIGGRAGGTAADAPVTGGTAGGGVAAGGRAADAPAAGGTAGDGETGTTEGGEAASAAPVTPPAGSSGGRGRVTVAVARRNVKALLEAESPRLVVRSRGTSREFEAFGVVTREGYAIRRLTVGAGDGADRADGADEREDPAADVTVLAVRRRDGEDGDGGHGWAFAPEIDGALEAGDEAFVVGPEASTDAFVEAVAR